jgi:hypothetical protein
VGPRVDMFHVLSAQDGRRLLIFEPAEQVFVWLEMWIPPEARKNGHARVLVNAALQTLTGVHFIDFPTEIKTFSQIATDLRWKHRGESDWFLACTSFLARSRRQISKIRSTEFSLTTYRHCPSVVSFYSRKELRKCIARVKADLAPPQRDA